MTDKFKKFYARIPRFALYIAAGVLVLGASVWAGWRVMVRPPAVPAHAAAPFMPLPPILPPPMTPPPQNTDTYEPPPEDYCAEVITYVPEPEPPEWTRREDFFTLLIIGHDRRQNTDTIMVAAYDIANEQAYIISIMRDTRVDVPRGIQRINAAYSAGRANGGGHDGGITQLREEVKMLIGFVPDFYVSVNERAFVRIVNAVSGVTVNVPFHMYYTDLHEGLHINIRAGRQRLNGQQALHFVRYRLGNDPAHNISDRVRVQHMQMLVQAMLDELVSPRTILLVPELISTYRAYVRTDLTLPNMLYFAEQFISGNVTLHTYTYPVRSVRDTHWYGMPDQDEAIALINRTVNPFTRELTRENFQFFGAEQDS